MVHLQVPPSLGPKPHLLGFQGSQLGLEPGLSTAEISHHGLHLLPVFLAQHLHLPGSLGLLILLQQPEGMGVGVGRGRRSTAGLARRLATELLGYWSFSPLCWVACRI